MADLNQKSKEEEFKPPATNKNSSEEDKYEEYTSWSEDKLRRLFKLVPLLGIPDISEEYKEHKRSFSVVCKLCSFDVDCIKEGSSLQDSRAANQHASLHRDRLDEFPTEDICSADQPKYSEAELLRIYVVDSHTWDCRRPKAPPPEGLGVVSYLVICKVCKEVVLDNFKPLTCLQRCLDLHKHAFLHSEYLCVDGPAVPELDVEDFKKEWVSKWVIGYEGQIREEDADKPLPEGFVKVCRWCFYEDCSSGGYLASPVPTCDICGDDHACWDCPEWQYERPPRCNGDYRS